MALRSVVLAPPPGGGAPRRTVVLRAGGPQDKGKAADLVTLLVGAVLLIATIALVQVLPNKEYALPQFSVTFPENQTESPSQRFDFTEAEASRIHEFTYDLPDNVFSITVVAFFRDENLKESLPDQFRVELFNPRGEPVGARADLYNAPPLYNQSANPPGFDAGAVVGGRLTFPVDLHPDDEIVQGLGHLEVKEQVLARIEPQHRVASAGTWTLRVTLIGAGDCPDQTTPDADPRQVLFCRTNANGGAQGQDPGNSFAVENFIYTTYKVEVEELS